MRFEQNFLCRAFMGSNKETSESALCKEQEQTESHKSTLGAAKAELAKAKEELKRAKEGAIQSWLDSKPLIDELEKQKSNLAEAQQSSKASNTAILELESQLETIKKCIKSKREDQLKTESTIQEINHALDQTRDEMEDIKLDIKKEKQEREKLRQILHLRKQKVQALQLTFQAATLESHAVEESSARAIQEQAYHSETRVDEIQLTHEDYHALIRRAKRKISRANWRVSVSMDQKHAAETAHELALSRLNKFCSSRSWSMKRRNIIRQWYTERDAKSQTVEGELATNRARDTPKSHAKSLAKRGGGKLEKNRRSASDIKIMKKKLSILYKMTKCLVQSIRKLRG